MHAEARKELQEARESAIKQSRLCESAELTAENMKAEMTKQETLFNDAKVQMEQNTKSLQRQIEEAAEQNKILHNQLSAMGEKVHKIQKNKLDDASQVEGVTKSDASKEVIALTKQLTDLREVINYMRSEHEICETQLQSARLSVERERASGEITKKSLEEARNELEILQEKVNTHADDTNIESNKSFIDTTSKLKQAEDQLILLRESNKLLRDESQKLEEKVSLLGKELDETKNAARPSDEKCRELEVDKAALEAEKGSLMREVDMWKERVTSLVSKFHQVRVISFLLLFEC